VLGALEGEEQRPREMALGLLSSVRKSAHDRLTDSVHGVQSSLLDALPDSVLHALPGAA
jgi:hypothetical protein